MTRSHSHTSSWVTFVFMWTLLSITQWRHNTLVTGMMLVLYWYQFLSVEAMVPIRPWTGPLCSYVSILHRWFSRAVDLVLSRLRACKWLCSPCEGRIPTRIMEEQVSQNTKPGLHGSGTGIGDLTGDLNEDSVFAVWNKHYVTISDSSTLIDCSWNEY